MFTRILLAVDGTESGETAVSFATALARQLRLFGPGHSRQRAPRRRARVRLRDRAGKHGDR